MNTNERSNGNATDAYARPSGPPHDEDPFFIRDELTTKARRARPRGILGRLAR